MPLITKGHKIPAVTAQPFRKYVYNDLSPFFKPVGPPKWFCTAHTAIYYYIFYGKIGAGVALLLDPVRPNRGYQLDETKFTLFLRPWGKFSHRFFPPKKFLKGV